MPQDGGNVDKTKIDLLGEFRSHDKRNEQGEVLPENESMNALRVRMFLETHGFTPENFNDRFNVDTALNMLSLSPTQGESEMAKIITAGKNYFDKMGLPKLIEQTPEESFKSTLHKELMVRNVLDKEPELIKSYMTYHTIRKLCERTLVIRQQLSQQMEKEKEEVGPSIKDQIGGVLKDIGKNFMKMSPGEKTLAIGGAIGLTLWISKSENETVVKIREWIGDAFKWGGIAIGGGFAANALFKVFTGKSGVDTLSDWVSKTAGRTDFFETSFKTSPENADVVRKSAIYMGDKDFLDLAQRYHEARANGKKAIELPTVLSSDMKPEEIYEACDTFFSKYPVEKLESKYRNFQPRPTWLDIMSIELAEDGKLTYSGDLFSRTYKSEESGAIRAWNWLMVGEGIGVIKNLYLKVNGKPAPSDEAAQQWAKDTMSLQNDVELEKELPTFLDKQYNKFSQSDLENYKAALEKGETDVGYPGIKFIKYGSKVYVVSKSKIANVPDDQKCIGNAISDAHQGALSFLAKKYPEKAKTIETSTVVSGGTRVKDISSYVMFLQLEV